MDTMNKPVLTEPGVKYFLNETLKQCRIFKDTYNNLIFNFAMLAFFIFILGTILLVKYKGKLTPAEKDLKNRDKQHYILSKIKNYQESKQRAQQELITGLPHWEQEYDLVRNK